MEIIQLSVNGFDNNFSYLLVGKNNEAIIIDPTGDKKTILETLKSENLSLVLQLLTHSHPDHKELVQDFLNEGVPLKSFSDLKKEPIFFISGIKIKTIFTPGHSKDSVCFLVENNLFTGDTLFVKGVGTTAFGGNKKQLEQSLKFLSSLDKDIIVWPGHDYGGKKSSLGKALSNSGFLPEKEELKKFFKKVAEYEKNNI